MCVKQRILLVEDNDVVSKFFASVLRSAGYEVHIAADGYEALTFLNSTGNGVSLIVADMVLPALDGISLVKQIKARSSLSHISIIAITALSDPVEQKRALEAGCVAFTTKPITAAHLVELVRSYLPEEEK